MWLKNTSLIPRHSMSCSFARQINSTLPHNQQHTLYILSGRSCTYLNRSSIYSDLSPGDSLVWAGTRVTPIKLLGCVHKHCIISTIALCMLREKRRQYTESSRVDLVPRPQGVVTPIHAVLRAATGVTACDCLKTACDHAAKLPVTL